MRTRSPAFFKSLNVVTQPFNQSTLTFRPLASLNVERKLLRGKARKSSLPFDYSWDMIDPICCKRKPLSDNVHLLVSFMVSGYLKSSREQIALKSGETNESNGSDSFRVLSPSWSLEVALAISSFSWGFLVHTRFESSLLVLDSVSSSTVISCTETSGLEKWLLLCVEPRK